MFNESFLHPFDGKYNSVTASLVSTVMGAKIVRLSVTCKINWAASENLQNFIHLGLSSFESNLQNPT